MVKEIEKPDKKDDKKPANAGGFKPDHDRLALEIGQRWKNAAFFWGSWWRYDSGVWKERAIQHVVVAVRKIMRDLRQEGWDIKITAGLVSGVVTLLESDHFVDDTEIDQGDKYINLKNGLLNVESLTLEDHRPELYLTNQLSFSYDEAAACPTWLNFLKTSLVKPDTHEPDWQLIEMLREAIGYSLTADTSMKASFWLIGKPDSGKSTLISFLRSMLGSLHTTIDLNQLASNRFMLASIAGKRCVTFTEARVNSVLPDDIFKSIVGGSDEIYADVKNAQAISFVPKAKFWWAMNQMPRTTDRSGAVFNRLHAIPFNRSIPRAERIANLLELLEREKEGVFSWAMAGYHRLKLRGSFPIVDQSEAIKEEYRIKNDTELSFLHECAIRDVTSSVQSRLLYLTYNDWCKQNGFLPRNKNQVSEEWERLGLEKRLRNGRYYWHGIKLRDEFQN